MDSSIKRRSQICEIASFSKGNGIGRGEALGHSFCKFLAILLPNASPVRQNSALLQTDSVGDTGFLTEAACSFSKFKGDFAAGLMVDHLECKFAYPEYKIAYPEYKIAYPEYKVVVPSDKVVVPSDKVVVPTNKVVVPSDKVE